MAKDLGKSSTRVGALARSVRARQRSLSASVVGEHGLIERVIADAGGLTTEQAQAIEMEARTLFGGKEQYIAAPWRRTGGRRTHPASRAAYDQALTSAPTSDKISTLAAMIGLWLEAPPRGVSEGISGSPSSRLSVSGAFMARAGWVSQP